MLQNTVLPVAPPIGLTMRFVEFLLLEGIIEYSLCRFFNGATGDDEEVKKISSLCSGI